MGDNGMNKLQLSHECLSMIYNKFLNEASCGKYREEIERAYRRKSKRAFELFATDWWNGKSELSKKIFLKQILEKDVGLDLMLSSFVNGRVVVERRRAKINAAKLRIERIMHPWSADSGDCSDIDILQDLHTNKRKRKISAKGVVWKDFVIETLLLHQVKEEEIEKGHYNTLLDLHVFNSGTAYDGLSNSR